jgi:hypothetical protein
MKFLVAAFISMTLLAALPVAMGAKYQLGVTPVFIDLGEIERGESKLASFNVITSSADDFMVRVTANPGILDFFSSRHNKPMLPEFSEEDATGWVSFMNNPFYLDVSEGRDLGGNKKSEQVNFLIRVPENAEPGYHLVELSPQPEPPPGSGTGVAIVAVTKINVLFRVPGEAVRSGNLLDITSRSYGSRTRINLFFQNDGSVSESARGEVIRIWDNEGNLLKDFHSGIGLAEPGEMITLSGSLSEPLEPGNYRVFANVTYFSGHTAKESELYVAPPPPETTGQVVARSDFPWWIIIIIVILVIAYLIYRYV